MAASELPSGVIRRALIEGKRKSSKVSVFPRYCCNSCRRRAYVSARNGVGIKIAFFSRLLIQLSGFVGRAEKMVELGTLFRSKCLLTLTGPVDFCFANSVARRVLPTLSARDAVRSSSWNWIRSRKETTAAAGRRSAGRC